MKKKEFEDLNTMQEINAYAAEHRDKLESLAAEKGLDPYLVELYKTGQIAGLIPDAMTGAHAKLDLEVSESGEKNRELAAGIAEYMKQQAMDSEDIANAVMQRDKKLETVCKNVWEEARRRKKSECVYIPPFEVFQMAKAYYLN